MSLLVFWKVNQEILGSPIFRQTRVKFGGPIRGLPCETMLYSNVGRVPVGWTSCWMNWALPRSIQMSIRNTVVDPFSFWDPLINHV